MASRTSNVRVRSIPLLAITTVVACSAKNAVEDSGPSFVEPSVLTDINPDPNIVEVQLVAGVSSAQYLPGKTTEVWAYRDGAVPGSKGTVPGPMLRAKVG